MNTIVNQLRRDLRSFDVLVSYRSNGVIKVTCFEVEPEEVERELDSLRNLTSRYDDVNIEVI